MEKKIVSNPLIHLLLFSEGKYWYYIKKNKLFYAKKS